jgi:hypothetical protein
LRISGLMQIKLGMSSRDRKFRTGRHPAVSHSDAAQLSRGNRNGKAHLPVHNRLDQLGCSSETKQHGHGDRRLKLWVKVVVGVASRNRYISVLSGDRCHAVLKQFVCLRRTRRIRSFGHDQRGDVSDLRACCRPPAFSGRSKRTIADEGGNRLFKKLVWNQSVLRNGTARGSDSTR